MEDLLVLWTSRAPSLCLHRVLGPFDLARRGDGVPPRRHRRDSPTARRRGGGRLSRGACETHRSRSTQEHDCATEMDEAGGERPMVRRKTSSEPVAGQKRKK